MRDDKSQEELFLYQKPCKSTIFTARGTDKVHCIGVKDCSFSMLWPFICILFMLLCRTAGVPSSSLGHSMWVSWWTKWGLGRFFAGFLPFSPTTNFIPPFLHTHLIHFISFHQPLWWCDRRGRPAPLPFTDLQYRGFITSHSSTRPCVGHKLRIYIMLLCVSSFVSVHRRSTLCVC